MNLAQRIILVIAFVGIAGMALFPPWLYVYVPSKEVSHLYVKNERPAGYHLLTGDHTPQDQTELTKIFHLNYQWESVSQFVTLQSFSMRIDTTQLILQIGATLLLAMILFFVLKSRTVVR